MTDPFFIRAAVPAFDAVSREYGRRSDAVRGRYALRADLAYGPGPRDKIDIIVPRDREGGRARPLHLFVHGGYWRAGAKEDYAFVAAPVVAAGGIAAIVEYDLMPQARMGGIVAQVRRAFRWLVSEAPALGADPRRITVSGHSAGAHLASYLGAHGPQEGNPEQGDAPPPAALLLISGIYDLKPIRECFLQAELCLTKAEVAAWSPVRARPMPGCRRIVSVGGDETPPFLVQAETLSATFATARQPNEMRREPGLNHMDIVLALGDVSHPLGRLLSDLVAQDMQSPA